jgi:hypothetical protein
MQVDAVAHARPPGALQAPLEPKRERLSRLTLRLGAAAAGRARAMCMVREGLLVIQLAHHRESYAASSDERLEHRGPHVLLEPGRQHWGSCLGTGYTRGWWSLLRLLQRCVLRCAPWVRVTARERPGELVHLEVEIGSREGHDTGRQCCTATGVA